MTRARNQRGFTVVELMVSVGLTAMITLWASGFINKPGIVAEKVYAANAESAIQTAMNGLVSDLQEANPPSITWETLPPLASGAVTTFAFEKLSYDFANPGPATSVPCQYFFQQTGDTVTLNRSVNGVTTVVAKNVLLPTSDNPFIQVDQNAQHMLIISLSYTGTKSQRLSIIRRVATKG